MPQCLDCSSPCNCYIEEDGFRANRSQDGRNNIIVEGSGSVDDPFTFSFMHSEFFRPKAEEILAPSIVVPSTSPDQRPISFYTTSVYYNGEHAIIGIPFALIPGVMGVFGNYFMVGASATFSANATGIRKIAICSDDITGGPTRAFAANAQMGLAGRDTTVSCEGFISGYLTVSSGVVDTRLSLMIVQLYQSSGVDNIVKNVKLWVTQI